MFNQFINMRVHNCHVPTIHASRPLTLISLISQHWEKAYLYGRFFKQKKMEGDLSGNISSNSNSLLFSVSNDNPIQCNLQQQQD
jgi:hypothetical protein